MSLLDKIRESLESLPQELAHFVGKAEVDAWLPPKTTLCNNLNNNIITPDKIPEFCLPPKLFRRKSLAWTPEGPPVYCFPGRALLQKHNASQVPTQDEDTFTDACCGGTATANYKRKKKPLPFSADGYGLAGVYESPNTRRKESLFHGKCPGYVFDRSRWCAAQSANRPQQVQKKTVSLKGFLPLILGERLSEAGSTEREPSSSSSDSTPIGSPYTTDSSPHVLVGRARDPVSIAASSSLVVKPRESRQMPRKEQSAWPHHGLATAASACGPGARLLNLVSTSSCPMEPLQCHKLLQHEHTLFLPGGGKVLLSTERTPLPLSSLTSSSSSSSTSSSSTSLRNFTARVQVMSVEGLMQDDADKRPLSCALTLCLIPGKLQLQKSATIRNCRNPVFNEDFFFTELSEESLAVLELRVKVMDRSTSGKLRRGVVRAVVTKPLSQLFPL